MLAQPLYRPELSPATVMYSMPQKILDAFFAAGGLTVYATSSPAWRWRACAHGQSLEAVVIDPQSLIESDVSPKASVKTKTAPRRKAFENHTLVRWLTRATAEKTSQPLAQNTITFNQEDEKAYAALLGISHEEWQVLGLKPVVSLSDIRVFVQGHNAALSDIESAFLPGKFDLPPALASFYIHHLTQARRDTEAALLVAQSCGSSRIPGLMAHALAVSAFEGAAENPVKHEGNDYASSAVRDTAIYIDAAAALAVERLALPADHSNYLLRLNLQDVTEAASDIVERLRPPPFAFLLKAKELYLARCDASRFPPPQRFLTALNEGDLPVSEPWVQRLINAYERLFQQHMGTVAPVTTPQAGKVLRFSRS